MTGAESITEQLAEFVSETLDGEIPDDVRDAARTVMLDGLAVGLAGSQQDVAVKVRQYLLEQGGSEEALVLGGGRLPAASAALANGVAMHCLDYEVQGYPSAHGTSSILPAILALAERENISGSAVVSAFAIGWDVQQRLRAAGEHGDMRGLHPPGVVGPMGAAAGASRMLGLDTSSTAMAFGMAASRAGGLFANNGTMTKATHPGNAARAGVESAELIRRGVTSNPHVIEDPRGYSRAMFGERFDEQVLFDGIGERFHLVSPGFSIKRFPAEIFMQWPMQAMVDLKHREQLSWSDVSEIWVEPPVYRADLSRPAPQTGLDGKFSYEYCVAVALTQDEVTIKAFSDPVLESAAVQTVLPLIRLVENSAIPSDKAKTWSTVTVVTRDGQRLTETCRSYTGSMVTPMSRGLRLGKVWDAVSTGLPSADPGELVAAVEGLDTAPDTSRLLAALRP